VISTGIMFVLSLVGTGLPVLKLKKRDTQITQRSHEPTFFS
jgi:hypothetical protein